MVRILWSTSSKGGSGKTLFSMMIHRALYEWNIAKIEDTLILDMNYQNRDLFNIIQKTAGGNLNIRYVSDGYRYGVGVVEITNKGPYLGVISSPVPLRAYITVPALIGEELGVKAVVVDTNINPSTFSNLGKKDLDSARQIIDGIGDVDPLLFFIWTAGSIMRYSILGGDKSFEVEQLMEGLKKLGSTFGLSYEEFTRSHMVVVINTMLWLYSTITLLKNVLTHINKKMLKRIAGRDRIAQYTFTRLTKDVVLKASRLVADALASVSGNRPKFRLIEILYMLALDHILFGDLKEVNEKYLSKSKRNEINLLLELAENYLSVEQIPLNLYVTPPISDIHNIQALIYSVHLLPTQDLRRLLGDPALYNLPYRLIKEPSKNLGKYLDLYFRTKI